MIGCCTCPTAGRRWAWQSEEPDITDGCEAKRALDELLELSNWLAEYQAQVWDEQIAADLEAGRLDLLLAEVDAEYEAGLAELL
jgi:hypothetical protein